jgi:hypothetical protein
MEIRMRGFSEEVVPHQLTIEAYGIQVRLCASTPELMAQMEQFIPPSARPVDPNPGAHRIGIVEEEDGTYSVYTGSNRACEQGTHDLAVVVLEDQIQSYVALNARDMIFIHAGVVANDGHAIVIPGESFSGKSTLVEALVRKGAVYYSDEFAPIDSAGRVHPYARNLSLRHLRVEGELWSGERSAQSLGGVAGEEPLPLGLAVITYYVPGAEWNPRQLSRGEAALGLLSKAVAARYRTAEAMQTLSRAVDGVTVLEGERGEADEFADLLLELTPA